MNIIKHLGCLSVVATLGYSAPLTASAQRLSIEDCWHWAESNYPLIKQYDLIERTKAYNLEAASKRYLPQATLGAKASYQSDVTKVEFDTSRLPFPLELPSQKKDQYGITLDVTQLVWDGGATAAAKESIRRTSDVARGNNEVSLYALRQRVSELYFALLLTEEQMATHRLYQQQLQRTESQLEAALRGGIVTSAELDAVRADLVSSEQTLSEYQTQLRSYRGALSLLTGQSISDSVHLERPALPATLATKERPELRLLELQAASLTSQQAELKTTLRPTIGLYAQGGYSRPGLNMLKSEFQPYYVVGARLSWNLGNFYTYSSRNKALEMQRQSLTSQREAFQVNQQVERTQQEAARKQATDALRYDDQLIQLRENIYRSAESKLLRGTLSATDAMRELTSLQVARQTKILHELQSLKASYDIQWTQGY